MPIRLGDANLDGFPDLLQVVATHSDQTPKLLFSVPCERGLPGCAQDGHGRRSFKVTTKGVESLNAVKDAISATFLDMDEDVSLQFVLWMESSEC